MGKVSGHSDVNGTLLADAVAGDGPSGSNPFGTVGLAPDVRILSVPVPVDAPYPAWERDDARAIRYAADHGAEVIFVGIIGPDDLPALDRAVRYAVSRNCVLVASEYHVFHFASEPEVAVPDSLTGVLGAASLVLPGMASPPLHYATPANDSILVAAPGNVITVSGPAGPGYEIFNSFAAVAWLTATAALVKSVFHNLPPGLVARAIAVSARDHPRGGYNTRIGFGLIDPAGALHAAARLAKMRLAARPGSRGTVGPAEHFGSWPGPGTISAVHHSGARLAGYGGAMAAGLALIVLAAALAWRWCRSSSQRD
jgi:subtilisin family serine protease